MKHRCAAEIPWAQNLVLKKKENRFVWQKLEQMSHHHDFNHSFLALKTSDRVKNYFSKNV